MKIWAKMTAATLGVALLAGCVAAGATELASTEDVPLGRAVETSFLQRTTIRNELTYIGQTQPLKTVNIASLLSAEVTSVNFDIGDTVQEGDVLFTVDAQDLQYQMRQLEASIAALNVGVETAQFNYGLAHDDEAAHRLREIGLEMDLDRAHTGLQQATEARQNTTRTVRNLRDDLDDAESTLSSVERQIRDTDDAIAAAQAMLDSGFFPPGNPFGNDADEVRDALVDLRVAATALRTSRTQLNSAIVSLENGIEAARSGQRQANLAQGQAARAHDFAQEAYQLQHDLAAIQREQSQTMAGFGVRSAQAQLEATRANLAIMQNNLGRAVVTSPISGVVASRNVDVGHFVSPQLPLMPFAIVQMDTVIVQVNVAESLISAVHPGQEVSVVIQALDQSFTGRVTTVSPVANHASTFPVRIELPNPAGNIRPGMFSQVTFIESQSVDTFVVPRQVVLSDEDVRFVYVVDGSAARRVEVQTGMESGNQIEILSGVSEADQIIVVGQEALYDGILVNVVAVDGERVRN